jgi:ABC-2 type transport system ATP-binding protein
MTIPAPAPLMTGDRPEDGIVTVDQLVKRYPKLPFNAVDGVSFSVRPGEVFGLLGPNGAGKTTTIGVLTTRVRPTSGHASVAGIDVSTDPVAARRALAVVPQRSNLDRSLTAKRNLLFHAAYFGVPEAERNARADQLLDEFGLADRADDKVDRFSGGQAQRLMIARALMHDPQVLFLDEPTTGLDPQARLFVWDRIRDQRHRNVTVLMTTHDMDEATELADRVGIMDHGKLLALDTPQALTGLVPGESTLEIGIEPDGAGPAGMDGLVAAFGALPGVERVERVQRGTTTSSGFPGGFPGGFGGGWGGPGGGGPGGGGDGGRGGPGGAGGPGGRGAPGGQTGAGATGGPGGPGAPAGSGGPGNAQGAGVPGGSVVPGGANGSAAPGGANGSGWSGGSGEPGGSGYPQAASSAAGLARQAGPGGMGGPDGEGGRHLRLYCEGEAAGLVPPVVRVIGESGATLTDLQLGRPSLEDVFIHLTGRGLRG